jgi:hypothetical protein
MTSQLLHCTQDALDRHSLTPKITVPAPPTVTIIQNVCYFKESPRYLFGILKYIFGLCWKTVDEYCFLVKFVLYFVFLYLCLLNLICSAVEVLLHLFVFYSSSLAEMVGELFLPHDMPEPPKQSFFQGLFGGGSRNLDREELCKYLYSLKQFF